MYFYSKASTIYHVYTIEGRSVLNMLNHVQWSLYFKTTHGTKKCGLILQVVLE